MSALPPTSADFEKARRSSKSHLIAHAMFMANNAQNLANSIRAAVHELKDKKLDEAAMVDTIQQMVTDSLHEMQLHILTQHLHEIGCAEGASLRARARETREVARVRGS